MVYINGRLYMKFAIFFTIKVHICKFPSDFCILIKDVLYVFPITFNFGREMSLAFHRLENTRSIFKATN